MEILNRLLEISVYSVILFLAVTAVKKICRDKMSPALHFMIWFLLIARLCIPVTINSGLKLIVISEPAAGMTQAGTLTSGQHTSFSFSPETQNNSIQSIPQTQQAPVSDNMTSQVINNEPKNLFQQIASVKWTDILITVWLLGILLLSVWMAAAAVKMKRFILKFGLKPTSRIRQLLAQCKNELGIKKNIQVYLLPKISTPALTIGFRPKIILPNDMAKTLSEDQLRFAVKHELMHYKRKDHLISILMRILEAVYWFNPAVWLMSKYMTVDMETACDSMVVKTLDKQGRKRYVLILLDMFSQKKAPQFVLGMVLNNTEKIAEKRIRGVYMKNKSKRSVKIMAGIMAAVLFVGCFTTACQPTPEKAPVVGKNDGQLQVKIEQTADPGYTYQAPNTYQNRLESADGAFQVDINAQVIVPQTGRIPAIKVSPSRITQEMADKIIAGFFGDQTLYKPKTNADRTKEEILNEILRLKQGDTDLGRTDKQAYDEMVAPDIERLEKEYQTAPDIYSPEISDGVFIESVFDKSAWKDKSIKNLLPGVNVEKIDVSASGLNGGQARLTIERDENNRGAFEYSERREGHRDIAGASVVVPIETANPESLPDISLDDAKELAQGVLDSIGLENFWLSDYGAAFSGEYAPIEVSFEDVPKCYVLFFTKDYGFPINYASNTLKVEYGIEWNNEVAAVYVDNFGVARVKYESPSEIVERMSDAVELLPFEEVMKKFESQILISGASFQNQSIEHQSLTIEKVQLGLGRIKANEDFSQCLYMPVWDFYGKCQTKYKDEENEATQSELGYSYLTINAIDGSIIDRSKGY